VNVVEKQLDKKEEEERQQNRRKKREPKRPRGTEKARRKRK